MKFVCPNCHVTLTLEALIEHDAAREAVRLALEFPAPLGKQLMQYVSLFKPQKRALSMDRFASIINELLPLINAAQIERNGRIWAAPMPYWSQAFDTVWLGKAKLTLPLKSHGYLFEVIVGFANKAEAGKEKQAEQGRIYGRTEESPVPPAPTIKPSAVRSEMPDDVRKTLRKLTGRKDDEKQA